MPPIDFNRRTALYRLFDADDRLLYVGIAFNPEARWNEHRGKAWWPSVVRKSVEWHPTRLVALEAEARAIEAESPRHNRLGVDLPLPPVRLPTRRTPVPDIPRLVRVDMAPRADGKTPQRVVRIDDETWAEYGLACAALGISRSDDLRMRAKERIAEWKRNQRREARDTAMAATAED